MRTRFLVCLLFLALAAPLQAQIRDLRMAPRTWVSVWGTLYTTVDQIYDPESDGPWDFEDNALGVGIGLQRQIMPTVQIGVEGSWARTDFERRVAGLVVAEGSADLMTARATARLQGSGFSTLSGFLVGGIGFFGYRVPDPDVTTWDFALNTGGGVEYRFAGRTSVYFEVDRVWAYHDKGESDEGNTGKHSALRLGLRRGL